MLTDAQKKYLLAIYRLGNNGMRVRSTEVSDLLGVSKASTVKMSRRLIDEGYIEKAPYGSITLTEQGIKAANPLYTSQVVLCDFLEKCVGVPNDTAEADSVTMVTDISEETVEKLVRYALGGTICQNGQAQP